MNESFKERMKRLRLRAGFRSQQDAADAIGCERGTVGMWEAPSSAVDSVSGDYLMMVARAYKVLPDYINTGKGGDGYPWAPDTVAHGAVGDDPETVASLRDEIDSLNATVAALVTAMCVHRPAEGADVARVIRKSVAPRLVRHGLIHELLQTLGQAPAAVGEAANNPPRAKR